MIWTRTASSFWELLQGKVRALQPAQRQERSALLRGGGGSSHWPGAPLLCLWAHDPLPSLAHSSSRLSLHFSSIFLHPSLPSFLHHLFLCLSLSLSLSPTPESLSEDLLCAHHQTGPGMSIKPSECWVVFPLVQICRNLYSKERQ